MGWSLKTAVVVSGVLLLAAAGHVRAGEAPRVLMGTVAETTNSGGYTYLSVNDGQTNHWVATTAVEVKIGSKVEIPAGMMMKDFFSPKLQRTFPSIRFVDNITIDGKKQSTSVTSPGHPNLNMNALPGRGGHSGKVAEVLNGGGYTFVLVQGFHRAIWAATKPFKVSVGDIVTVPEGDVMPQFRSASLNRTFEEIRFVEHIEKLNRPTGGATASALPAGHPQIAAAAPVAVAQIAQPSGAKSVAEIFAQRKELAGQEVTVKGQVTKFMSQIMGRNWIHLSDGTGEAGSNDLTITTTNTVAVGDVVLARGKLVTDRDFGSGYAYAVILEDAAVQKN